MENQSFWSGRAAGAVFVTIGFLALLFQSYESGNSFADVPIDFFNQTNQMIIFSLLFLVLIFTCGIMSYRRGLKPEGVILIIFSLIVTIPVIGGLISLLLSPFAIFSIILGRTIEFFQNK